MNSKVYNRIKSKFDEGIFTNGNKLKLVCYGDNRMSLQNIPIKDRTPGLCALLLSYNKGRLSDVPVSSRTKEFFIKTFTNKDVNEYIRTHLNEFDRDFFKDLIATNSYSTMFDDNCFNVMPLEYIDEEMCSIAAFNSSDWSNVRWFHTVYKRKREAITKDIFMLAARLYPTLSESDHLILNMCPEEYKDDEFYFEVLTGRNLNRLTVDENKNTFMDYVPEKYFNGEFLMNVVNTSPSSLLKFNERALNVKVKYDFNGSTLEEELWKYCIRKNGELVEFLPLNDEVINFFLINYSKDSSEYKWSFKNRYKEYKLKHEKRKEYDRVNERVNNETMSSAIRVLAGSMSSESFNNVVDNESNARRLDTTTILPIKYEGNVPNEYRKEYDSEEFLELMYNRLGIKILEQRDYFFYTVILPEGWVVERDGYYNYVKNENNELMISYFYDSKFYDMDAYVNRIHVIEDEKKLTL